MSEPTVFLCGACHAIAPSNKWLVSEASHHEGASGTVVYTPPLVHCPACGIGYDPMDTEASWWSGSWPQMIRRRLDLIGGQS